MNVLVIGANGKTGLRVIKQLKDTDHKSVALVRKEEQISELKELGADQVILGNLEDDFSHAFEDIDVVIFTAGSGGSTGYDKTLTIDLHGAMKAVDYAKDIGVKQFLQVSATDSPVPGAGSEGIKPYAVAKHASDFYIQKSGLNYTIVQPGPLLDDEGTGKISLSFEVEKHPHEYKIPRDDVATILVETIDNPHLKNKVLVVESGDVDIKEALKLNN